MSVDLASYSNQELPLSEVGRCTLGPIECDLGLGCLRRCGRGSRACTLVRSSGGSIQFGTSIGSCSRKRKKAGSWSRLDKTNLWSALVTLNTEVMTPSAGCSSLAYLVLQRADHATHIQSAAREVRVEMDCRTTKVHHWAQTPCFAHKSFFKGVIVYPAQDIAWAVTMIYPRMICPSYSVYPVKFNGERSLPPQD